MFPIIDGHNDALMDYAPVGPHPVESFLQRHADRQLDLPGLDAGGVRGGLFAVFIPDEATAHMIHSFSPDEEYVLPALEFAYAQRMALAMAANLFRIEAASEGRFKVVRTADEMAACMTNGTFGAVLHFEGAEAIDPDFHALEVYYQAGLRSLGLVWSRPTLYAEGVPFKFPHSPDTGPGLTDAGRALVRACNHLGILIDLSHLNEKGFWDVARLTDAPLVASHSNAHNLCPLPRNLTDRQLDAIKESGGLVGVNFVVMLVRSDAANNANTPLQDVVRHVDYLVERMGIDHVGFGSDFGAATVPNELRDASHFPVLIDALRRGGYDDEALNKLTHQNWLRVLRQTWKAG
ncbi:MAG: dipeptidase [Anaerolineae bacterium]|nr:dipeptidase [Anaerolineae bacterium]